MAKKVIKADNSRSSLCGSKVTKEVDKIINYKGK